MLISKKRIGFIGLQFQYSSPTELRVQSGGAIKNGVAVEDIREVFQLLTLYAGIPASIEAHRIAMEVMQELE